MSEIVRILGIDPSLRNTGLAIVQWHSETKQFKVMACQTIKCPPNFKGNLAILEMIGRLAEACHSDDYLTCDFTVIESPAVNFNPRIPRGTMINVAHIAGAAAMLFNGTCSIVKPSEWNKGRQKEKSAYWTEKILGPTKEWEYIGKKKRGKLVDEHQIDAAGLALWFIRENYLE